MQLPLQRFSKYVLGMALLALPLTSQAQEQLSSQIPQAMRPHLAQPGAFAVGVRTEIFEHPHQLDLTSGQYAVRQLTVELWYPATTGTSLSNYPSMTKSQQRFIIKGTTYRDAKPAAAKPWPIVVLSHGYPGNRTLMFYLAEHLASHGYLVAAIDHPHSTYGEIDQKKAPYQGFLNTLYHRSRDQQFVLDTLRQQNNSPLSWLQAHVDTKSAAVIGYSMGGYGALNTIGGCFAFTEQHVAAFTGLKDAAKTKALQQALNSCAGGQLQAQVDPTWKAAIAIAPWGGQHQLFSKTALQQLTVPLLFLAGDQDEVSGYAGMRALYEQTGSPEKYFLTYHHAGHNIAPHAAPQVSRQLPSDFAHYHEASWASDSLHDINKHIVLAMLDCHVKSIPATCELLQADHPEWPGYQRGLATGLSWMSATKQPQIKQPAKP